MKMFKKLLGAAAIAAVVATASVAPANASLIIELSTNGGGFTEVDNEPLEEAFYYVAAGNSVMGTRHSILLSLHGQGQFGSAIMDSHVVASFQPLSNISSFSVRFTQTDINLGSGSAVFTGEFSNNNSLAPQTTILRSLFLNNNLIFSSTELTADVEFSSALQAINGPFTLTEQIDFTNVKGSGFSMDDKIDVPEPGTIALMIAAMLSMLGFAAWRRRSAH
jgi:hypothetical protein